MSPPRILVLGGAGMLGHELVWVFHNHFETWSTIRSSVLPSVSENLLDRARTLRGVEVTNLSAVAAALDTVRPEVVVNAVGVIKQRAEAADPVTAIAVNSLFPHQLASLCRTRGIRLIHISTDCVFSGRCGPYGESDVPDPSDLYGRSKLLGELDSDVSLTLRTSLIGHELTGHRGLVEWFLAQSGGEVLGHENAVFSGLPTVTLGNVLIDVIERARELHGLYHVSSDPITKLALLRLIRQRYDVPIAIVPSQEPRLNRALNSTRFREVMGFRPAPWGDLVDTMALDWLSRFPRRKCS